MTKRRLLRPWELLSFVAPEAPRIGRKAKLNAALTIPDLRSLAERSVPRYVFDYADGAADTEQSLSRARTAFNEVQFNPRMLRDVGAVDLSTSVLGINAKLPFGIAPTGFTRIFHTDGEIAGARAAGQAGIPFSLSTVGTTSVEDVKTANELGSNWIQLYVRRDRHWSEDLMRRASECGYDVLLLTVDVPVAGRRLRDIRNGFRSKTRSGRQALFGASARTIFQTIPHVGWWMNFLTTAPIQFSALGQDAQSISDTMRNIFDPSVTYADIEWIRREWPGKVVIKGVQSVEDARVAADLGADGIVLSTHGGRQLDRAPAPLHLLPHVAGEVGGDMAILIDSGIMSGSDIVAALALGADFALVGRAYTYGLMAGGEAGAKRAITILAEEVARTMQLLGVTHVDELEPAHVSILDRYRSSVQA